MMMMMMTQVGNTFKFEIAILGAPNVFTSDVNTEVKCVLFFHDIEVCGCNEKEI
jgi:hypothetical protein